MYLVLQTESRQMRVETVGSMWKIKNRNHISNKLDDQSSEKQAEVSSTKVIRRSLKGYQKGWCLCGLGSMHYTELGWVERFTLRNLCIYIHLYSGYGLI